MRKFLLVTASLACLATGPAFAISQDAAFNKSDNPLADSAGNCVRTKWMKSGDPCAPTPAPRKKIDLASITKEQLTIYFDFNSAALTMDSRNKLDQIVNVINESKEITEVKIHGFTDQIGSAGYNDALAKKRAANVKTYLDNKSRLRSTTGDIRGLGKSEPNASCQNVSDRNAKIACMKTERRVEIEFNAHE